MTRAVASIDDATRRRIQEMLLTVCRISHILDDGFQRAGLTELASNRTVQVLVQLRRHGAQRPRDLQGATGLTSGGLTKLIDRLEAAGVVERHDRGGRGDGRAVLVRLNRAGHAAARKINDVVADAHDDCRPLGKDVMQLAESCGARPTRASSDGRGGADLASTLARSGRITLAALGDDDERRDRDDYLLLITLCHIDISDEPRPGSLTDLLNRSSGGVSKLLDRFEAQGWIAREYGGVCTDRRAVVLRSTPAGRRLLREQTAKLVPSVQTFWELGHALAEGVTGPV
jgi:DNA-binding MarR family transcriptional regulator